jgi:hypothetical protein
MTPAQLDHLKRLDAHLDALLALAAKRTPGEWKTKDDLCAKSGYHFVGMASSPLGTVVTGIEADAAFIAACAGRAEAGWRATKAAIADWLTLYNSTEGYADGAPDASTHDRLCNEVSSICRINLGHILAAWPIELLILP